MQRLYPNSKTHRIAAAGLCLGLGLILPFATSHGLGLAGTVLLPMHIPVFLCGLLCGGGWGFACGLILPVLNSILTSMPTLFPMVPIMTAELSVYGLVSGTLYCKSALGKHKWGVYVSMLCAAVLGRLAYAAVFYILLVSFGELKALTAYGAFITGVPGLIIQLLLVPPVVFFVKGNKMKSNTDAVISAKNLIAAEKATCVVIKDGKIINIAYGRGISPVLSMYDEGMLEGAVLVDKVIGRATAMIAALGGVRACVGVTVSRSAYAFLCERGIPAEYENLPDSIINRQGDGICPMEAAVSGIDEPTEALAAVRKTLKELSEGK